jgi:transposase
MEDRTMAGAKKKSELESSTIVWVDESGFYLMPGLVRTYAPQGETPVIKVRLTRDHLSSISGITSEGKLYMMVYDHAISSVEVVAFLKHLLRHIPGNIIVIWDGSSIHRSRVVKNFLADEGSGRLHLERLPGYAPDLNPDEGIWKHLKQVELKNFASDGLSMLRVELRRAKERLRHKVAVIRGCIRQPGYTVN